ncbi:hypothetical protein PDE_01176 [Penicillium oxalicum 114-2]|uniref:Uncharacterized protein n=1 Tax=Penicillium oxalicum (strain 114-2 / CGMCC 5302) TaxID=933388 RepID=S7Z6Q5_PENO1|nr:hypothetical protein PDE_01176 [Penicillium oxalicum 114-2]
MGDPSSKRRETCHGGASVAPVGPIDQKGEAKANQRNPKESSGQGRMKNIAESRSASHGNMFNRKKRKGNVSSNNMSPPGFMQGQNARNLSNTGREKSSSREKDGINDISGG